MKEKECECCGSDEEVLYIERYERDLCPDCQGDFMDMEDEDEEYEESLNKTFGERD